MKNTYSQSVNPIGFFYIPLFKIYFCTTFPRRKDRTVCQLEAEPTSGKSPLPRGPGRAGQAAARSEGKLCFSSTIPVMRSHKHHNSARSFSQGRAVLSPGLFSCPSHHTRRMGCRNGLYSLRATTRSEERAKQSPLQRQLLIFPSPLWQQQRLSRASTALPNVGGEEEGNGRGMGGEGGGKESQGREGQGRQGKRKGGEGKRKSVLLLEKKLVYFLIPYGGCISHFNLLPAGDKRNVCASELLSSISHTLRIYIITFIG